MKPVENFKAIGLQLCIFGIQPLDIIFIAGIIFIENLLGFPAMILLFSLICAIYVGRKSASRSQGYFASLWMYLSIARFNGISIYEDVEPYASIIERRQTVQ